MSQASSVSPDDYAALHAAAIRLLSRLEELNRALMPETVRRSLRAQRRDLEALVALTAPHAAPVMDAALQARRPRDIDELWEVVRTIDLGSAGSCE